MKIVKSDPRIAKIVEIISVLVKFGDFANFPQPKLCGDLRPRHFIIS